MANSVSIYMVILFIYILNNVESMVVNSTVGEIEGTTSISLYGAIVNAFYGIPFAQPPIGELRWASPQKVSDPIGNASNPFDATIEYDLGCPHEADASILPDIESEDCLYLNIYTPLDAAMGATDYTVMIWIYGGSYKFGWGTQFIYDATNWVDNEDVIIVTLNYRLGILGFLYDNTYDTGVVGNYGMQDQGMAIEWVYDNIAYFGGNPENINIFGESAGASAVSLHLLYNQDYIKSGIMQSNFPLIELRTPETWYNVPSVFSVLTNCSDYTSDSSMLLECWRNVPVDNITTVQGTSNMTEGLGLLQRGIPWTPTVNTEWLKDQPMWALGRDPTPPFMTGTNGGEGYSFIDMDSESSYTNAYLAWLYTVADAAIATTVLEYYNVTPTHSITGDYRFDNALIVSDWWRCSIRYQLAQLGDNTDNIYYYNFDVVNPTMNENAFFPGTVECYDVACHFVDVFYIFMTDEIMIGADALKQNTTIFIGEEMQRLWSNFAKTLDANDAGDDEDLINVWPQYTNDPDTTYNFLDIIDYEEFEQKSTDTDTGGNCDFWDQVGYAGRYSDPNATPEPSMEPTGSPTMEPIEHDIVTPSPVEPESIEPDDAFINKPHIILCMIMGLLFVYLA